MCPGRTYGGGGNVEVRIAKKNLNFNNSFQNSKDVAISVASVTQSGGGANGAISATVGGDASIRMPDDWNPAASPFPAGYDTKVTEPETSTVTLQVPPTATAGTYSASVAYQASGPGYLNNGGTSLGLVTDVQGTASALSVTWTVLAAGDLGCNRAPTIASAGFGSAHVECSTGADRATLSVTFDDLDLGIPGSGERHVAAIDWGDGTALQVVTGAASPLSVSHTFAAAGSYRAAVAVTDQHGANASTTAGVTVDFRLLDGGFRPPINQDGSSVFRAGSTVPVKIRFADCDGSIPTGLAPELAAILASSSPPGSTVNEPIASTSAADSGRVMRFSDGQWIYNLATSSLKDPSAKYRLTITVPATGEPSTW